MWARVTLALVTGGAVLTSIAAVPGPVEVLGAALAVVVASIAVVDARNFIIPDWLSAVGLGLAVVHAVAQDPDTVPWAVGSAALRGAVLSLLFLALRYLYARIRDRQGIGLGDVKLAGVAGVWLDWVMLPIVVELAALVALAAYGLGQILKGRPMFATDRVPFGVFFAPAIWVSWLLEQTFLTP